MGRVGRTQPQGPEVSSAKGGLRPCGLLGLQDHEQTLPHSPGEASLRFLRLRGGWWGPSWITLVTPATRS